MLMLLSCVVFSLSFQAYVMVFDKVIKGGMFKCYALKLSFWSSYFLHSLRDHEYPLVFMIKIMHKGGKLWKNSRSLSIILCIIPFLLMSCYVMLSFFRIQLNDCKRLSLEKPMILRIIPQETCLFKEKNMSKTSIRRRKTLLEKRVKFSYIDIIKN